MLLSTLLAEAEPTSWADILVLATTAGPVLRVPVIPSSPLTQDSLDEVLASNYVVWVDEESGMPQAVLMAHVWGVSIEEID